MLMRRADLFIVYCVTLLPELNVTEDATNGLRTGRGGRSGLGSADITATMFPTMGHISNLSANKQFINVGQMKCIHCNKWSVVHNIWIQNVGGAVTSSK